MKKALFSVLLALLAVAAYAQNISVRGTVRDTEGEPIPGAGVVLEGTTQGVATDLDGRFTLTVPSQGVLVFSSLGFAEQRIPVAGKSVIDVVLTPDSDLLDDVVVTAQGITRKEKSIGYATQQVDAEKLSVARQTDLGNAMAGKIAGARFYGRSGATFDSGSIILRGTSDFRYPEGAEPIYVIDGAIGNKDSVNMDDVESINVLKGAAATALYGSQGGNGAVIITTKKARLADRGSVEVSHTLTFDRYYNHFNMQREYGGGSFGYDGAIVGNYDDYAGYDTMSPQFLYGNMYGEMQNADGSYYYDFDSDESWGARFDPNVMMANANYFDPTSSQYLKAKPYVAALDLGDLFRTGVSNTTNVAFAKAGNDYTVRVSYTNNTRRGLQFNSDAQRHFLGIKTTYKPKDWLNVSMDYKYTYRKNHNAAIEGYGTTGSIYYNYMHWGHTSVDLKDFKDYRRPADGSWRTWNIISPDNLAANFHDNPYATFDAINYNDTYNWNVFTGDVEALLPANFKLGFKVIGNIREYHRERKRSEGSIDFTSYYYEDQNHVSNMTLQGRLTWGDRFIDNRLSVDAAAFVEQMSYDYGDLNAATTDGLVIDGFYNLAGSNGYVSAANSQTHYKTRSVFGTVTAGFDDTYFLDASLRNDWDSRLPLSHNHYLYGGLSASVMLNQFFDARWLNYWKLRASAAQVGSTLGAYATTPTFTSSSSIKYNSLSSMYRSTVLLNDEIQPTLSTSYEVGTEFRMFGNRFWGDVNYYMIDTKNQILNMTVAPQSGYSSRQLNTGLVRNRGIEVSLGGTPVQTRDFSWDIDVNIAKNVNTLVSLNDDIKSYQLEGNSFYYFWYLKSVEGEPMGAITTMARWARNDDGKLILRPTTSSGWGGGYYPVYETNVEKTVGNFQPDWTGGFSTSFRYKNFSVAANFDFVIGGQMVSWTNMWSTGSGTNAATSKLNPNGVNEREPISKGGGVYVEGVDQDGNPVNAYMNAYNYYHYLAYYDLDNWVYDRTYLKMRELSVSYNFPKALLQKAGIGLSSASLSFVASNPWLIYSACPNVDPSETGSNWLESGQAAGTRSFGFTIKLGF